MQAHAEISLDADEMRAFQDLAYAEAGIRLSDAKRSLVQGRLRARLERLGLASYAAYHRHIASPAGSAERQHCLDALTTNETFFFRHKQHWDFVLQQVVSAWQDTSGAGSGRPLRAWSAACSTGEEAYSLAILLHDVDSAGRRRGWSIEATDLNASVIETARRATYGIYALQKVSQLARERYFRPCGDECWRVREEIRRPVRFARANLLEPGRGPAFDLIFLRNVLIYFDDASKARVIAAVTARLRSGGHLILGGAESLHAAPGTYDYVRPAIYRRR
ncbi:MAG: CheR family methyltransferase [Planctomycetota bacterium]